MRYGKRILIGNNGDVQWCELTTEEVAGTLRENVSLNATVYEHCMQAALAQRGLSLAKDEDRATLATNPRPERDVSEIARALFAQCAVKGFVALQEAFGEKIHHFKTHNMT